MTLAPASLAGLGDFRCMGAAFRLWISWSNWQHWCPSLEQISRGAYGRFHGVLAGTPDRPNSRYRQSVTPHSVRKVEPAIADMEAEGPDEPELRAGRRKGLCCTEGRPAMRLKRVFNRAAQA